MKKYIRIITVSYATRKVLLIKENDNLSKELTSMVEDRNKYRSRLQDQEYYLTDEERNEIAEKIIQRKDLELEDGERTFDRDDLDLSR